jgi:carotenoid 1,2-hydratase
VGSVFSPYYAAARRRGPTEPEQHCAINVALYGPRRDLWAMTERSAAALERDAEHFAVGRSAVHWDGNALTVDIDEMTVPLPRRLRGRVRLVPTALTDEAFALDAAGRHLWRPLAPLARVEVAMTAPQLSWRGTGYLDSNAGSEPLEAGFRQWAWSRAPMGDGAVVLYDADRRDGSDLELALRFDAQGRVSTFDPPPRTRLPTTLWRVGRQTRSEAAEGARVGRTLEDTPFYARSVVHSRLLGENVEMVHEALCLDRFSSRWVQTLLPFRMPRRRR